MTTLESVSFHMGAGEAFSSATKSFDSCFLCAVPQREGFDKKCRIPWKPRNNKKMTLRICLFLEDFFSVKICVETFIFIFEPSKDVAEAVRCHPNASILAVPKPCLLTQKLCTPRSEPHTAVHSYA